MRKYKYFKQSKHTSKKMFWFTMFLFMVLLMVVVSSLPSNDLESWRMYAVYDVGYDTGRFILEGGYEHVSLLQGCIKHSDYSFMKNLWDNQAIQTAEKLFFYGCMNANGKKMAEKEFIKTFLNLR